MAGMRLTRVPLVKPKRAEKAVGVGLVWEGIQRARTGMLVRKAVVRLFGGC